MGDRIESVEGMELIEALRISMRPIGAALMKSIVFLFIAAMVLPGVSEAKELPEAPSAVVEASGFTVESAAPVPAKRIAEAKPIDATFVSLAIISTGSTFADSYTTLFARQNWLAGKKGVCNVEKQSPYLYGTHPTVGRAYAVASAKSATFAIAAYYLRKHHNRFWSLALVGNSVVSLEGVTQNMVACN